MQGRQKSLFQNTFERSLILAGVNDIYIVTNENYKYIIKSQIEEINFIMNEDNVLLESEGKNTLPAIYAGVSQILKNSNDTVVVFPSDHMIVNNKEFIEVIKESEELANESLITFGIKPDNPITEYGYILPGEIKKNGFIVKEFKEKPTLEKAIEYVEDGYFWNAGIFMFNPIVFSEEVSKYTPEIYNAFKYSNDIKTAYERINKKISIDYGIFEKSDKVVMVPVNIGWSDLGSFAAFFYDFNKDEDNNITNKENVILNSKNNIIYSSSGKIISTIGAEDYIIIENGDKLLVCKNDQTNKIKDVIEILNKRNDLIADHYIQEYQPWGNSRILEDEKDLYKINRITINKGEQMQYCTIDNKCKRWIVVRGQAKIIYNNEIRYIGMGDSIYLDSNKKYLVENLEGDSFIIIEVELYNL